MKNHRDQPGDPEKGGKVIVETVLSGRLPFRLLLGSDAARAAEEVLEGRLQELRKWRDVSSQADF